MMKDPLLTTNAGSAAAVADPWGPHALAGLDLEPTPGDVWRERPNFMLAMLGDAVQVGTGTGVSRVPPESHPEWNWMLCTDAELMTGIGVPYENAVSGMIAYRDPSGSNGVGNGTLGNVTDG